MSVSVEAALRRLTRIPGVVGAMVVDSEAGLPVASELAAGTGETALSALAGSLFSRTSDASSASGFGRVRTLQVESREGHVIVSGGGPLLVVALAESAAQVGMIRVEATRVAGELSQ
ncbi:MAG TPA: roadblock/LC7 domain-containing protein [Longimicrobiales bacterium]|nr:roadblock/LC7 domain-containing protein [Longimicrobiales bacterium]